MRELLEGGDRRSLGRSGKAVERVLAQPEEFGALMECIWDDDPVVRMRAADAAEKVSAARPDLLMPYQGELLGLMEVEGQQEVRWHLALMVPRLALSGAERRRVYVALKGYLGDKSSIVRTLAMQGLADLAKQDAEMRDEVVEVLRVATRTGTAAMRARGRKLLGELES